MKKLGKIKDRLTLTISFLLIIGFLTTNLIGFFAARTSMRNQISYNSLPLTSDNIYSEIQRDLLKPIFISSLMASDTFLRDWILKGEKNVNEIERYLKEIKHRYNTVSSFFVSEKTHHYYYSEGILKKIDPTEERDIWYFRVREMDDEYEVNVDPDMANQDAMTIFINYRVYDYNNNYIGATGVGLAVSSVKKLIEKYQKVYNRDIYFVDQEGNIKMHGLHFPDSIKHLREINGLSDYVDNILNTETLSLDYSNHGNLFFVNTRYIEEFQWYLVVEQKESVKDIQNILLLNLLICLLVTLLVLIFTHATISRYQKKLEMMATTDKLTGVYNRRAFDIMVEETIKDSIRNKYPFSVILFDFDHFKFINDTYGHIAGDIVVQNIIQLAKNKKRKSDILCRWGGEEFFVLLKKCELTDAYKIAEDIRNGVMNSPTVINGKEVFTTVSLGVAEYKKHEQKDDLFQRADQALYTAKNQGRNKTITESEIKL